MKENIYKLIDLLDNASDIKESIKLHKFEDMEIILGIIKKIVKANGNAGMPIDKLTDATYNEYLLLKSGK